MEGLIYLAAAIPFAIIAAALVALATVRYAITRDLLKISIFGFAIRKIPFAEIQSVVYLPAEDRRHFSLLHHGGTVIVMAGPGGRKAFALTPGDAESFSRDLKDEVLRVTGRRV